MTLSSILRETRLSFSCLKHGIIYLWLQRKNEKGAASKSGKKRLTKAELDRQKAIKRMLWTFFFAFVLIFPVFRLGFFGITLYNLFRVFVGSMAYPLILPSISISLVLNGYGNIVTT